MCIVEATAAWEWRSCLGHSLGAKSLVAAVQFLLRVYVDQDSGWPCGHPSSLWSCWASRGKTEALTQNSIGKQGQAHQDTVMQPATSNAEWQPGLLASASHKPLLFSPTSIFYLCDPEIVPLFYGLCILHNKPTSN